MAFAGPNSFADPLYAQLAAAAEQKFGLPSGILNAIRTLGERSNANQVSPAGARTPYQFIPSTRNGFIRQYGVDPWKDAPSATEAAAIHLAEDYKRTGSWDEAIARYNGGTHPGRAARAYQERVGEFDTPIDTNKPYYTGAPDMASSLYPVVNGVDPLAPEPPMTPVPINSNPGPSAPAIASAPQVAHKRGGILGALESIFMPSPDSLWGNALKYGLTNAREGQQLYREGQTQKALDLATAQQKLMKLIQGGEYQIVGNNVLHIKPDGSAEFMGPPPTPSDKERMFQEWQQMPEGPQKKMLERILLAGQSDEAQAAQERLQQLRNQGTLGAARLRGQTQINIGNLPPLPPGAKVIQ